LISQTSVHIRAFKKNEVTLFMSANPSITDSNMLLELTSDIVSAYVANNAVPVAELPSLINQIHSQMSGLVAPASTAPVAEVAKPAVSIKKSVSDDEITCLDCGKKFKSLKRHLMTHHDMTAEQYREKWSLSHDYPMVAPAYAAARSELAKSMGLGRKPGKKRPAKKK